MKKLILLAIIALCFSCSSSEDAAENPIDATPLVYTTANIEGAAYNAEVSSNPLIGSNYGDSYSYSRQDNNNGGCDNINYTASLFPVFNDALPYIGVGFNRFIIEQNLICSDELDYFDTLFPVGSYDYSSGDYNYGVRIEYATKSDGSGTFYTSYGPQDSSASFAITGVETYDCGFNECIFVIGTFSCKLYNGLDATDTVDITNGTFKLSLKSYYP